MSAAADGLGVQKDVPPEAKLAVRNRPAVDAVTDPDGLIADRYRAPVSARTQSR